MSVGFVSLSLSVLHNSFHNGNHQKHHSPEKHQMDTEVDGHEKEDSLGLAHHVGQVGVIIVYLTIEAIEFIYASLCSLSVICLLMILPPMQAIGTAESIQLLDALLGQCIAKLDTMCIHIPSRCSTV